MIILHVYSIKYITPSAPSSQQNYKFLMLAWHTFLFPIDNDGNGEVGSNVEFSAFSLSQIAGHYSEPTYEELDISDSYYVNDIDDPARGEMAAEMNSNIAYLVSKRIDTKENVAYAAVGGLQ